MLITNLQVRQTLKDRSRVIMWDEQSKRVRVKMNKYCRANNYTPFLSLFNAKAPHYLRSHSINYQRNLLQE